MYIVSHEDLRKRFQRRINAGQNVDQRVLNRLGTNTIFKEFKFLDQEQFLRLIWQTLKSETHILAPPGQPRTLRDVAERILVHGYSISRLGSEPPLDPETHKPAWFSKCIPIDSAFDYEHFWEVVVVEPNKSELEETPHGNYYLHDGNHKALVLAYKILSRNIAYQAVSAIFMSPRDLIGC